MSEHLQLQYVRDLIVQVEGLLGAAISNNEIDVAAAFEIVRRDLEECRSLLLSKSK